MKTLRPPSSPAIDGGPRWTSCTNCAQNRLQSVMDRDGRELMHTASRNVRNVALCAALMVLIVTAVVVPHFIGGQNGGPDSTRGAIAGLEAVVELYAVQHNDGYPVGTTAEARAALVTVGVDSRTGWPTPPYLDEWPGDEWGTPLFYEYPTDEATNGQPAIWSAGADMQDGTNDDVANWADQGERQVVLEFGGRVVRTSCRRW